MMHVDVGMKKMVLLQDLWLRVLCYGVLCLHFEDTLNQSRQDKTSDVVLIHVQFFLPTPLTIER
jgi:hypothetical protein